MLLGEHMEFACWNQWEELYLKGQALQALLYWSQAYVYPCGAIPSS